MKVLPKYLPALLCMVLPTSLKAAEPKAPNILWVITDDQRWDSINAFNRMVHDRDDSALGKVMSPNVDRLAKMGTTYINTYNQNPSCAPSRTSMHTGRYSHRTGVYGFEYYNPKGMEHWHPLVPQVMRDAAGYQTVTVGKRGIRYVEDLKKGEPSKLYDVDLGYRKEFATKKLIDWSNETDWKTKEKTETFYFENGDVAVWTDKPEPESTTHRDIARKLDLFRDYRPGQSSEKGVADGEIIGGVNPQPGDKTRDGSFSISLIDYLKHPDQKFTTVNGKKVAGPATDKPLFVHCGFDFPHTPVLPPEEFRKMFSGFTYDVPEFSSEELENFPPQIQKLYKTAGSNHYTSEEKQQMISDYFAFCAYGDSLVGKTVDAFIEYSESQQRPWLVLYVCGDHGWRLNEHGMIKKFGPFDTDLKDPIIVASSDKTKFPADKVVTDLTTFVDMSPTFFAAAGIDISKPEYDYLDGRDLALVASGKDTPRDYTIAEPTPVIGPCALIRTKDYKFSMKIRPKNIDGKNIDWALKQDLDKVDPMFFDLRVDPDETHNLAADPYYRPVIDAMRKKLQDIVLGDGRVEVKWSRAGGDEVVLSNFAPGADDGILELPQLEAKTQ
ncbi:sulfatase-like hydrolase/transferase [Luteolibacter algae]|uniref:Sulfatase-like hydrolase/transferase n=1 Tax=Luteolibacter algae TaxID=454151 RepID=A0ABW5D3Z9_9BACT